MLPRGVKTFIFWLDIYQLFNTVFPSKKLRLRLLLLLLLLLLFCHPCKIDARWHINPLIRQWTNFHFQRTQPDAMVKMEPLLNAVSCWSIGRTYMYAMFPKQVRLLPSPPVSSSCEWDGKRVCTILYEFILLLLSVVCDVCMLRCVYGLLILPFFLIGKRVPIHIE